MHASQPRFVQFKHHPSSRTVCAVVQDVRQGPAAVHLTSYGVSPVCCSTDDGDKDSNDDDVGASSSNSADGHGCYSRTRALIGSLLDLSAGRMPQHTPREFAAIAGALGQLGHRNSRYLQLLTAAAEPHLPHCTPAQLSGLGWGLGRLRFLPGTEWATAFAAACADRLQQCQPQELGLYLWAFAKWQRRPPVQWLEQYYAQVRQQRSVCSC